MKQLTGLFFFFLVCSYTSLSAMSHPGDSIVANHTSILPVIDGEASDAAWNAANWIDINYTWMPYNTTIQTADFSGRYKVMWNKTTNLLYFLVEITDDKFVNGYVFGTKDGSYPNFDVLEVFIDEVRPGGDHAMNSTAFAYHITSGNANIDYQAIDIYDPTNSYNWGAGIYVDYSNHLPEFKRSNVGSKYIWEFSLMVLKSNYKSDGDPSLFKASLADGKQMGLTLAYCDNDNSAIIPKRDHFIASKYEDKANNDISWQNSTTFAHLTLKEYVPTAVESVEDLSTKIWVDGAKKLNLELENSIQNAQIQLFDISGRMVLQQTLNNSRNVDLSAFKLGYYLVLLKDGYRQITRKIFVN